jgi:hypothetical protein
MRLILSIVLLAGVLSSAGCAGAQQEQAAQPKPAPEFRPTASVKDIMHSIVDPNADFIWESVATIVDATGTHEKFPQNDEEWAKVRASAVSLMEASNLLIMEGRHVMKPGEQAEDPEVSLKPERIEELINSDRTAWMMLARGLQDAAAPSLDAADKKNPQELLDSGEAIDQACENCHMKYWYPPEAVQQQQEQK